MKKIIIESSEWNLVNIAQEPIGQSGSSNLTNATRRYGQPARSLPRTITRSEPFKKSPEAGRSWCRPSSQTLARSQSVNGREPKARDVLSYEDVARDVDSGSSPLS